MKNFRKNALKSSKGITLIALVITIIVLLILAGISISMLSGDNSILQKATDAKERTERADAKEQAQLDILAWQSDKISKGEESELNDTIIQGILSGKSYVKTADSSSFTTSRGEYIIQYSELYQANANTGIDWNVAKTKATSPHSEQTQSGDIGIGTDGELVNLDYWMYSVGEDGNIKLGGSASGSGSGMGSGSGSSGFSLGYIYDIVDGKIVGKMPQYIKLEGTEGWHPVTDISRCFSGISNLVVSPDLPTTISEIPKRAFGDCISLSNLQLPRSVTTIGVMAFWNCNSLTNLTIPHGVTTIGANAFALCGNLESITIPNSVISIGNRPFYNCNPIPEIIYIGTEEQWDNIHFEGATEREDLKTYVTFSPNAE